MSFGSKCTSCVAEQATKPFNALRVVPEASRIGYLDALHMKKRCVLDCSLEHYNAVFG